MDLPLFISVRLAPFIVALSIALPLSGSAASLSYISAEGPSTSEAVQWALAQEPRQEQGWERTLEYVTIGLDVQQPGLELHNPAAVADANSSDNDNGYKIQRLIADRSRNTQAFLERFYSKQNASFFETESFTISNSGGDLTVIFNVVPEPSSSGLALLGVGLVLLRRKRLR